MTVLKRSKIMWQAPVEPDTKDNTYWRWWHCLHSNACIFFSRVAHPSVQGPTPDRATKAAKVQGKCYHHPQGAVSHGKRYFWDLCQEPKEVRVGRLQDILDLVASTTWGSLLSWSMMKIKAAQCQWGTRLQDAWRFKAWVQVGACCHWHGHGAVDMITSCPQTTIIMRPLGYYHLYRDRINPVKILTS